MSIDTAKKAVDILFDMYEKNDNTFINHKTKAIILDFIGGEPLMAIDVIDYICTYFVEKCLELDHPWLYTWRASMISNGALYFDPKVQEFLKKFRGFVSFGITIDGPKDIHDSCRIYHDGRGNFNDAYAAFQHFNENYYKDSTTKVTIAPENLDNLNKIIKFFVDEGIENINANTVFEAKWTYEQANKFYEELKIMADYLLALDHKVRVSLFDENNFHPMDPEDNRPWCGGNCSTVAFDPDGVAYPCIRYTPSSLGNDRDPIIIGNVDDGLFTDEKWTATKTFMNNMTRRSQSTDECFYCPIAQGCAQCIAWDYQLNGTPDSRCTRICPIHKARSLANVYYWNNYYKLNNINKKFKMYLSEEEALKIISKEEYKILKELSEI